MQDVWASSTKRRWSNKLFVPSLFWIASRTNFISSFIPFYSLNRRNYVLRKYIANLILTTIIILVQKFILFICSLLVKESREKLVWEGDERENSQLTTISTMKRDQSWCQKISFDDRSFIRLFFGFHFACNNKSGLEKFYQFGLIFYFQLIFSSFDVISYLCSYNIF